MIKKRSKQIIYKSENKLFLPKDHQNHIEFNEISSKYHEKKKQILNKLKDSSYKKRSLVKRFHKIYSEFTSRNLTKVNNLDLIIQQQLFDKLYINEYLSCFYALFSIVISICYEEFKKVLGETDELLILPFFISIFSIFLWVNIIFGEIIFLEYDKHRGLISSDETLSTSKRYLKIIAILSLFFFHPNIFTANYKYTSYYEQIDLSITRNLNSCFTVIVMFRLYFVFRFLLFSTKYMQSSSDTLYKTFYFNSNFWFCTRAIFKEYSIRSFAFVLLILGTSFAYIVKIFESDYNIIFENEFNSIYYLWVSMITIGYGDYVVRTGEARFFSIWICFISILYTSLMTVSLTNLLKFSKNEENVKNILDIITRNKIRENHSSGVLKNLLKISFKSILNIKKSISEQTPLITPLKKSIREFKNYENIISGEVYKKGDSLVLNSLILSVTKDFETLQLRQNLAITEMENMQLTLKNMTNNMKDERNFFAMNPNHKYSINIESKHIFTTNLLKNVLLLRM